LLLAGAGGGMDAPLLSDVAEALATRVRQPAAARPRAVQQVN
jgi:predicted alpha/beta-hydrolase family hydrolase